ncbi:MAG TPA: hypothetical protein VJH90_03830 [archaeon]|nr:hypothetical protein [archaeon]
MFRHQLVEEAVSILEENNYATQMYSGSFDIAAKEKNILILKVLLNVDSFLENHAKDLKIISHGLGANTVVIGKQTRFERLKEGVVYERFDIPTLSVETFRSIIENKIYPEVFRDRGGSYVRIDSEAMRAARKKKGLSQRELGEMLSVNKKTVYEHEREELRMFLETARNLERVLEARLIRNDSLSRSYAEHGNPKDRLESSVGKALQRIGFQADYAGSSPFDILAISDDIVLSTVIREERIFIRKAEQLNSFSELIRRPRIAIAENSRERDILGVPVIDRKDLTGLNKRDFLKIAKESN